MLRQRRAAQDHVAAAVLHVIADLDAIQHHLPEALPLLRRLVLPVPCCCLQSCACSRRGSRARSAAERGGAAMLRTLWHLDALGHAADVS